MRKQTEAGSYGPDNARLGFIPMKGQCMTQFLFGLAIVGISAWAHQYLGPVDWALIFCGLFYVVMGIKDIGDDSEKRG